MRSTGLSCSCVCRPSPRPARRRSHPVKDSRPPNQQLGLAVKAQQRSSPRGPSADSSRPPKTKDRKESKEPGGKAKEDKVSLLLGPQQTERVQV